MRKIPSLFARNYDGDKQVRDEIVPGSEWVAAGEGVATRKWDGTSCLVRGGALFKRYDAKHGKTPPAGWEPCQEPDPVTGHWPGWMLIGNGPEDRWFREVADVAATLPDGTYELCGPKISANPEALPTHTLIRHGAETLDAPREFERVKAFLTVYIMEGIVWHHPDGRMVKIKARDFGIQWPRK
jgi:hypothetical protein